MSKALIVRFRVDFDSLCSIGAGKIELLEGIARTGSLSQAARDMKMSYRRAWLLLEDMKLSFDRPVTNSNTGGLGGGGSVLTEFGERLIAAYRKLESGIQRLAGTCLRDVDGHVRTTRSKQVIRATSIKRRLSVNE